MLKYLIVLDKCGDEVMNDIEFAEFLFSKLKPNSLNNILNEFNRGEIGVLSYLAFDKNEVSAGELSDNLNVTTARIASILNSLESKEYISRSENIKDKRKILVRITKQGKELAISAKQEIIDKIIKIIQEVGHEELKNYIDVALKIKKILDEN